MGEYARDITTRIGGWIAVYHGGEYIDVFHASKPSAAVTCINVYDYAAGEPTIPFTRNAVRKQVRAWLCRDEDGWREADDIETHVLPYH